MHPNRVNWTLCRLLRFVLLAVLLAGLAPGGKALAGAQAASLPA